eukprot:13187-Heterococcus_DN1.PRE.4
MTLSELYSAIRCTSNTIEPKTASIHNAYAVHHSEAAVVYNRLSAMFACLREMSSRQIAVWSKYCTLRIIAYTSNTAYATTSCNSA